MGVPGRTGKACRERWISRLDPNINRTAFSEKEELKLMELHQEYNNKWAKIAKHLPGRTADAVKSKYISIRRREQKDRVDRSCQEFLHSSTSMAGNQLDRKRKDFPMTALEHQCSQSPPKHKRRLSPISAPYSVTDSLADHHFWHAKSTSDEGTEDSCVTEMVCNTLDNLQVHDLSRCSHDHHTARKPSNSLDMDGDERWLNDVQSYSHISSMSPIAANVHQVKEEADSDAGSACADANATADPDPVEKQRGGGGGGFLNMLKAKLEHIEPLLLSDDFPSNLAPGQGLPSSGHSTNNSSPSSSPSNHTYHASTHQSTQQVDHQMPAACAQRP